MSLRSAWIYCMVVVSMVPASLRALNQDFLNDTPLVNLSEADKAMQRDAALFVLEDARPDLTREWSNPLTGASGRIDGQGDLISEEGLRCRKIRILLQARGAESVFVLPLCKDNKGEWFFGSGLKLRPVGNPKGVAQFNTTHARILDDEALAQRLNRIFSSYDEVQRLSSG